MTEKLRKSITELQEQIAACQVKEERAILTNKLVETRLQLWEMRRKSWQGQCEACGKKKDSNFSYRGLLHEEAPIKARCQDCAEKSQCDICGQWSKKIGCLTISGGRFYKTLNFCDKVCRKEAKKQAQELIWRYNMAQRGLNP